MRTAIIQVPDPIIPGHKRTEVVPVWPEHFHQELRDSQQEKANSKYPHGSFFGYYNGDNQLTEVYILVEHEQGLWSLINSQSYEPWTPPLLIGPYVADADIHVLNDGYDNLRPI